MNLDNHSVTRLRTLTPRGAQVRLRYSLDRISMTWMGSSRRGGARGWSVGWLDVFGTFMAFLFVFLHSLFGTLGSGMALTSCSCAHLMHPPRRLLLVL